MGHLPIEIPIIPLIQWQRPQMEAVMDTIQFPRLIQGIITARNSPLKCAISNNKKEKKKRNLYRFYKDYLHFFI
jgi:hypothetical protein